MPSSVIDDIIKTTADHFGYSPIESKSEEDRPLYLWLRDEVNPEQAQVP